MDLWQSTVMLITLMLVVSGCGHILSENIRNPSPKDYLTEDDADIFMLDGNVYSNAEDVDWVNDTDYKTGEKAGVITKRSDKAGSFEHGTANDLPVGTTIHQTNTQVYVAVTANEDIPYLKMVEG